MVNNGKKLKIQPITGRQNFKCCYQKQSDKKIDLQTYYQEKDAKITKNLITNFDKSLPTMLNLTQRNT